MKGSAIERAPAEQLSLGEADPSPFWEKYIVIAAEGSPTSGDGQDTSASQSAKMGKDEGVQTGAAT